MTKHRYTTILAVALAMAGWGASRASAAAPTVDERQQKLISVLQSDAPTAEKAITCKFLAIYGNDAAVPALAPLLTNKELCSWARIALEAIPGPAADAALRDALDKAKDMQLVGVINSIGYRRDAKAVDALAAKLTNADAEVASAAAAALGHISGDKASDILVKALATAPAAVRTAVAEGCLVSAEQYMEGNHRPEAMKIYDAVRNADVIPQRRVEATRGAILAREGAGVPILVELMRSSDKQAFNMAMRVARELAVPAVTDALVAELPKATVDRQVLLIQAMGDRGDARALPTVLQAMKSGEGKVRPVAASVLPKLGTVVCVPPLLEAAITDDAALSKAARDALVSLAGKDVDAAIMTKIGQSSGKVKAVLIEVAEQRKIEGALPVFVQCAGEADADVRNAALVALGAIGEDKQIPGLVQLLGKTANSADREPIERAITSICARWAKTCPPLLLPLTKSPQAADRVTGVRTLAGCGGPEALGAIRAALADKEEVVQDEAVRTLATWPNRWPDDASAAEPLLEVAKSGAKPQHKVLALRGYLQYIQGARKRDAGERLAMAKQAMGLATRPEEKRQAISVLAAIGTPGALEGLVACTNDAAVVEEACAAIVDLSTKARNGIPRPQRQAALKVVLEKSKNESTINRAKEASR